MIKIICFILETTLTETVSRILTEHGYQIVTLSADEQGLIELTELQPELITLFLRK